MTTSAQSGTSGHVERPLIRRFAAPSPRKRGEGHSGCSRREPLAPRQRGEGGRRPGEEHRQRRIVRPWRRASASSWRSFSSWPICSRSTRVTRRCSSRHATATGPPSTAIGTSGSTRVTACGSTDGNEPGGPSSLQPHNPHPHRGAIVSRAIQPQVAGGFCPFRERQDHPQRCGSLFPSADYGLRPRQARRQLRSGVVPEGSRH